MMKLKGTLPSLGGEVVILALSLANLDRLRAEGLNGYIRVDAKELGISHDIIITAAATEQEMLEAFRQGITEGTKLHISGKLKS